jgi:hypothetical protein
MTTPAFPSYAGHRFPAEIISHAVWLYFRFPLTCTTRFVMRADNFVLSALYCDSVTLYYRPIRLCSSAICT